MNQLSLVTVYTQVYNTKEEYLRKCIDSVLSQTYEHLQYIIVDNGSSHETFDILKEYEKRDSRILLIRFEKNEIRFRFYEICHMATGEYFMALDSDDWINSNCIENLLSSCVCKNLDICCTGTFFHVIGSDSVAARAVDFSRVIEKIDYAFCFTYYHVFFRAIWGKLIKMHLAKCALPKHPDVCYGLDTLICFHWLRLSNKIGIINGALHHYRVHGTSVSYQYMPLRFQSDLVLFQDALDFLQGYGPVSLQNLTFLYIVYCNAVTDTLNVIEKSQLSPKEKLEEYKKIALEPITQGAYQVSDESATNSKGFLFLYMLKNASLVENSQDYLESLSFYLPHCSKVLAIADADLLGQNDAFFQPLLKDDASLLRDNLLQEFKKSPYRSQEKIVNLLSALTDELPVCKTATTHRFINHFFKIYGYLLHSQHLEALEEMTDLLLNHRVKDAQEVFFQVYLTLAALLQQEPAYLFGKIQMAEYLFSAKHYQEAAQIVAELEKMGLSEHDDVVKLKKKLARYLPA